MEFLYYNSTTSFLVSLIYIKKNHIRSLGPYYNTGNRLQPYGGYNVQIHVRSPRGSGLCSSEINDI